jgi:UDP-N-acetylglucosamine acyltransferase
MIHESAHIHPDVIIGKNVYIGPGCIIGFPAEDKKHWGKNTSATVVIGDNVVIHGNVTIDAGTIMNTEIKQGAWIMKGCHIGHDSIICEDAVLSPHVIIGGHCHIHPRVKMGMGSIVHQRRMIPHDCIIGMGAVITKSTELWERGVFIGNPATFLRYND